MLAPRAGCSSHSTKPRRPAPPASVNACAASVRKRIRRQWSHGRRAATRERQQAPLADDRLDRVGRALPPMLRVQPPQVREAGDDGVVVREPLRRRPTIDQRPPASRTSNSAASEQPNAGGRSAATRRISSAGSSIAPRIDTRSRHSVVANRSDWLSIRRGTSAASNAASSFRQQCAGRHEHRDVRVPGRAHPPRPAASSGAASGSSSSACTRQPSLLTRRASAASSPASRTRRAPTGSDVVGTAPPRRATGTGTCGSAGRNAWSGGPRPAARRPRRGSASRAQH